jgi:hypothetical protein
MLCEVYAVRATGCLTPLELGGCKYNSLFCAGIIQRLMGGYYLPRLIALKIKHSAESELFSRPSWFLHFKYWRDLHMMSHKIT